jgi:hypothetical protein
MTEATSPRRRRLSSTDQVVDVIDTVKAYARQETIEPLKGAARWVAVGSLGALSLGLALIYVTMAVLRLSQDLGGTVLDGSWSFVHYFITLVILSVLVGITFSRISQSSLAKGK